MVGMIAAPLLRRLDLSRVAFLGTLIAIVVTALGALALRLDNLVLVSAFPVVVTALVVERWWIALESEGRKQAMRMTANTLLVALLIQGLRWVGFGLVPGFMAQVFQLCVAISFAPAF